MAGIIGYGAYLPRYRIKVEDISATWGTDAESYKRGLLLQEKSVPGPDQDTITLAVEASRNALKRAGIDAKKIGAVYIGSESHPYAVKPSGTVVAESLNCTPDCHCADFEFACKAGSESMFVANGLVESGQIEYGLSIGADTSQGAPGDALEYSAAAGAAAFIMGKEKILAIPEFTYSYMSDTPDFWRREHQIFPKHASRFTGEPAYFSHTIGAATGIMKKAGMRPDDFAHAVFHQPNGKFPMRVGKMLGFKKEQLVTGLLSPLLGNTYSAASPLGLTAILDIAKPGDYVLMVSYGSGAGSDAFVWKITDHLLDVQDKAIKTRTLLNENKIYIDYGTYAKFRNKIKKNN